MQSGDPDLAAKSASARKLGSTRVIGRQDIVYTTDEGAGEQVNAQEEEEFDRQLGRNRQWLPPGRENRVDDVFGKRDARGKQRQREAEEIEVDWSGSRRREPRSRRDDSDWERLDRW